jgi:anthranilate/para-aminobenzoate synthase component II
MGGKDGIISAGNRYLPADCKERGNAVMKLRSGNNRNPEKPVDYVALFKEWWFIGLMLIYGLVSVLFLSHCSYPPQASETDAPSAAQPAETAETVKELAPDGIMFSNGPGDPAENTEIIENIKEIQKLGIPIFGICLGHQLMALANGGRTEKLKYGHRGANQPVIDMESGLTYVTSQNHGYAVIGESISPEIGHVSHINANDKTCEGIRYTAVNAFTVQFHPEAHGGPLDTSYLFDEFITRMKKGDD